MTIHAHKKLKEGHLSPGAMHAKIAFDEAKHKRGLGGKFAFQGGKKAVSHKAKNEHLFFSGKGSGIKDTDVIKLHVDANPKKAGSSSAGDFAKLHDGMTVGEFKAAVGPKAMAHIAHDKAKGFITVHDPKTLPPEKKELTKAQYIASGKTSGVKGTDVIKLHPTEDVGHPINPKKPGSKSADEFAKYKDEMTVDQYVAAVGDKKKALANIAWDKDKGFVSLHVESDLTSLRTGKIAPLAPKPKTVEPVAGVPKVADLPDDTQMFSKIGTPMKVGEFKDLVKGNLKPGETAEDVLQKSMNEGVWTVKAASATPKAHELGDDVVLTTKGGMTFSSVGKSGSLVKVADIKDDAVLMLSSKTNPFGDSSPEGIKFKSFLLKPQGQMTMAQYKATQALTPEGKSAALQKLIDEGHVQVTTKEQAAVLAKVKVASSVKPVSMTETEVKASVKWKSDDPRWSKAAGIDTPVFSLHNATQAENEANFAKLQVVRNALGAKVVNRESNAALDNYKGNGYQSINGNLRAGGGETVKTKALDALMAPMQGDAYLFRGHNNTMLNGMPPPADFVDLGYSSVSFNPGVSKGFAGGSKTLFRVRVPKGAMGVHIGSPSSDSELRSEAEVVLARGTRFRYVSHETVNGYKTIEVEVVRPDGSPYH